MLLPRLLGRGFHGRSIHYQEPQSQTPMRPLIPHAAAGGTAAAGSDDPQQMDRLWEGAYRAPSAAYVHLPFCKRKCFYCDFPVLAVGMDRSSSSHVEAQMREYTAALCLEISTTASLHSRHSSPGEGGAGGTEICGMIPLSTVYFGGGTPSLVPPPMVAEVLSTLSGRFGIAKDAEVWILVPSKHGSLLCWVKEVGTSCHTLDPGHI